MNWRNLITQAWKASILLNGSHHLRDAPSVTSLHPAVHAVRYKVFKHLDNQDLDDAIHNKPH